MTEDNGNTGTLLFVWGPNVTNETWPTWNGNYSIQSAANGVYIAPFIEDSFASTFDWVEINITSVARGMNTSSRYPGTDRSWLMPYNRYTSGYQTGTLYHTFRWIGLADGIAADGLWWSNYVAGTRTDDAEGIYTLDWTGYLAGDAYTNYSLNNDTAPNSLTRKLVIDKTPPATTVTGIVTGQTGENGWNRSKSTIHLLATDPMITGYIYKTFPSLHSIVVYGNAGVNSTHWIVTNSNSSLTGRFTNVTMNGSSLDVTEEGINNVVYWSQDNVWNVEADHSDITIKIDTHAPTVTTPVISATLAGSNGWLRSRPVTIGFTSSDTTSGPRSTWYRYYPVGMAPGANTTGGAAGSTFDINTDGNYTFEYYADDSAGNVAGGTYPFPVKIDTQIPVTTLTLAGDHAIGYDWNATYTDITLIPSDTGGSGIWFTRYNISDSATPPGITEDAYWTNGTSYHYTTEGTHYIHYYATDNAGNNEAVKTYSAIKIDNHIPVTTLTLSGDHLAGSDWNATGTDMTLTPTDTGGSGVWFTRYSFSDSAAVPDINNAAYWTNGTSYHYTTEGIHYLHYYSVDYTGGQEAVKTYSTIKIDKQAPQTALALDGDHQPGSDWNRSFTKITLTPADTGGSGVWFTRYNISDSIADPDTNTDGYWTNATYVNYTTEGTHYLHYYSVDNVGNKEAVKTYGTIKIDIRAPQTTLTVTGEHLTGSNWNKMYIKFTLAAVDTGTPDQQSGVMTTRYMVTSGSAPTTYTDSRWTPYSSEVKYTNPGTYHLYYYSMDNAGNNESILVNGPISIDDEPPVTAAIISGDLPAREWNNTSVSIAFSAVDPTPGSGVWFTRYNISDSATPPDNGTDSYWSNYTISVGYSTAGIHYLHYYSVDNANNTETTKSSAIKIDKQAPVTSFALTGTHTARSDWNNTAVGITLSAVDAGGSGNKYTRYMLTTSPTPPLLTDSGWTNYAGTFTYAVEGTHYLYFYSMDYALNNETIVACPCPIRIDTSAPPTTTAIISGDLPAREWNNTSVRIAFSAIDPVSGTWFTRYNISDSATPPDNGTDSYWSNYTIPVDYSTAGIHYLHYYSVDNANNTETTKSSAIKIDKQAPVTSFALTGTHPAGSDWNSTGVGITLTAVDAGGSNNKYTRYMFTDSLTPPLLTDSGWSTYGGTFTYSVEGTHYLHFYSMDYALNNETIVTCPCPIRVDMGAPTIPQPVISGVRGTNGWNTTLVTITFNPSSTTSGINNSWYRYYYQDTTPLNRPANTSGNVINVPSDGNYTVEFYTDSNSGNLASARLNIKIDTFAPVTSNTTLSGTQGTNGWYITPVSFDIGASDASGIAEASGVKNMTYVFNHTGVANTSVLKQASALPWHITEATEGISCYYFYSWDNAGNNGTLRNLTIKIDTKEPTTASTINGIPGKNGWNITNVSMFLTPTDSPGTVISATYYRINGQGADPFTLYTGPVTISDERNSTVEYYSVDEAGKEEMVNARNVLIDRTKPTTTIILNGSEGISGWFNSSVIINLTATDNANGSGVNSTNLSSTNINSFTRYDGNVTISSEGITTIYYYSTDNASNPEIIHSQAIKIDKSAPVTTNSTIGALDPDGWYTSDVSVMLTPTDTGGSGSKSTWYRVNGGTYLLYAPFQLTTEGNNTVEFFSTDNAGNNETPQRMQIKIGKSLPHTICTLSGTTNGNGAYTSDVSVNLTATEDGPGIDYLCYNLNGGLFTTVAGNNTTFKLTGGTYVIKYFAVDRIGRHESTNNTTVTIDRIAPVTTASLNRTATNGWYTSDVNVTLTATDSGIGVDFVRYSTNGGGYTVIPSGTTLTIVDNGTTTIRYYAVDKAGNSENIANCVVKIDKAPPTMSARVLSGTLLGDTSWYTTNVTVELSAADSVSGPARIVYNVSGSGDNTIAGNVYYVPVTLEGNVTIWFHAIDNAGNAGAPQSFNLSVDRNPLTTNCTLTGTKGNNDWYSTKVTVNLTAGDRLSEVNYTEYSFDNVNWINYTGPFEYGLNGIGTIYYHSKDIQGYVEPIRTRQLKIDLTDPQAICTLSGTQNAQGRFTSDVTVSLSGSDQSGIVQIQSSYDGSTWEMYTGPFVVPNGSSKLILYRAWDNAGRVGGNQTWIFFVNDAGQPTPTPTPTPTPGPDQIATITPEPTATPTPGPTGTPTTGPPPTPTEITSVPGFTVMAAFAALAGAMAIAVRNRQGRKK